MEKKQKEQLNGKLIVKNTLMLYIRMFILVAVNLYTSRLILNLLGVEDYGLYNVVGGIIIVISFINSSMAGATQRFLNVEMGKGDIKGLRSVFNTSVHIHFGVSLAILLIAETLGLWFLNNKMNIPIDRINAAFWVYQFSIGSTIFNIASVPYNAVIIANEKMSAFAYISIAEALLKIVVISILLKIQTDKLIVYSAFIFVISVIIQLFYRYYSKRKFAECKYITLRLDFKLTKKMLSFSGWTMLGNLGYILHTQGMSIVLNMFFSVVVNAAVGIATQVNSLVTNFSSSFLLALNPQIVKTYAAHQYENMHCLLMRGCKTALCLVAIFVIPLTIETKSILSLWLGFVPEYADVFIKLTLYITLINSISAPLVAAKGATGQIKSYQIILTTIGAFHLPLSWIAFEFGYGPEYSMYIYLTIVVVLQIVRIYLVCKSINLKLRKFYTQVIVRCFAAISFTWFVTIILHNMIRASLIYSISICLFSILLLLSVVYIVVLDKNERKIINNIVLYKIFNK